MTTTGAPSEDPCPSCPYRVDVPAGIWEASEYEKLTWYDRPTGLQPSAVFLCHLFGKEARRRLCAGWVGCHPKEELLSLRVALLSGDLTPAVYEKTMAYVSPVPLFPSGAAAAEHGLSGIDNPDHEARVYAARIRRVREKVTGAA